jgi:hypothetical protein
MRRLAMIVVAASLVVLSTATASLSPTPSDGRACYSCLQEGGGWFCQTGAGLTTQCTNGCGPQGCGCELSGIICNECCIALNTVEPDGRAKRRETVVAATVPFGPEVLGRTAEMTCKGRVVTAHYGSEEAKALSRLVAELSL